MHLGVIGGSSLFHSDAFQSMQERIISTFFGDVKFYTQRFGSNEIVFCQRHHADAIDMDKYTQPGNINFKAIVSAFAQLKVDTILSVYSVGSMDTSLSLGTLILPDDYFHPFAIQSLSVGYDAHCVPGIDLILRQQCVDLLVQSGMNPTMGGTYVQASGPRFETKAEIKFFAQYGVIL